MEPDTSFVRAEEDVKRVAAATERRPEFCAEGLTRRFRVGLLIMLIAALTMLCVAVFAMALSPEGLFDVNGLFGALFVGATVVLTFASLVIFGALAGNNPRLSTAARMRWYAAFLLAGPVALPVYWAIYVWPVPYEPMPASRLGGHTRPAST